eukprot:CAMPEP_0178430202 /NCGR_PEP_ID=MMETSP0689_2-20121128/31199_1 /TAXON_ID=160604 /ORGANISM="Amphidinium massartii, Strain CS-259" /LENGTH=155 /DNA_ID=CAMNT_0020052053 /DNA_START=210 /DNA_END=674 /DNA_ORIENTATION=+
MDGALPDGWTAHQAPDGRLYYFNAASGVSSWDHPATTGQAPAPDAEWEAPLVEAVRKWFMETEMQQLFEDAARFADANCDVFELDREDHKLEYTELHKQYQQFFENKLDVFLQSLGYTKAHFEYAFEKRLKTDDDARLMGELMWCALDYEFFCGL